MTTRSLMGLGVALLVALSAPNALADGPRDLTAVSGQEARALLDTDPQSSGLVALAARDARRRGQLIDAAWLTDLALRLPGPHPLAVAEGQVLGWDTPAADAAQEAHRLTSPWPWWLAGVLLLGVGGLMAWRRRDALGGAALVAGALWAAFAVPPVGVSRPSLPAPLASVSDGAPCAAGPMTWRDGQLRIAGRCDGALRQVVVTPSGRAAPGAARTTRHEVTYLGAGGGPEVRALVTHVVEALSRAEAEGYTVPAASMARPDREARWRGADPATRARLQLSAGLVVATLMVLLGLLGPLLGTLRRGRVPGSVWLPASLAVVAVLLVPAKLRMVYGGYDLTAHLVEGVIPRYGPGALWFYGPSQWLFGGDHAWVQGLNRLFGLGAIAATIALAGRWFPRRPGAREATAWLLATLPVVMAAHSCESIHPGPVLGLLVSLWLWSEEEVTRPVAATLPWLAAAVTRPELAVVALAAPVVIWWRRGRPSLAFGAPGAALALAALGVLGVAFMDILGTTGEMASRDAIDLGSGLLGTVFTAATFGSVLASPTITPTVVLGLVVGALIDRDLRPTVWPIVALAVLWMAVTGVDHATVSLPRIQLGPLLLVLPLAGAAVGLVRRASRGLVGAVLLLYVLGVVWSGAVLWGSTNEDHEERLWRGAVAALPQSPACVAAMGYGDRPEAGNTPRHNPGYLLQAHHPEIALRHLGHLPALMERCPGPVYALLGTRCHTALRRPGEPVPGPEGLEACRQVRASYALTPIVEAVVDNRGDTAYPMYAAGEQWTLGLYAVAPRDRR